MLDVVLETLKLSVFMFYVTVSAIIRCFIPTSLLPTKDLSKDTALVTGAGSGIGRELTIQLAKAGCKVVLWDINEEGNKETAAEIKRFGGQAHAYTVDVSNREQIYKVADQVLAEVGVVDILINNAGIGSAHLVIDCPDDVIEKTVDINLMSHFWATKAFLPGMLERDHGYIVGIASVAGLVGKAKGTPYGSSKAGVIGYLESLNLELKTMQKSIGTTVVCPYFVHTPLISVLNKKPNSGWLLPVLQADYVASKTIEAIQTDQKVLYLPKMIYFIMALKGILPTKAYLIFLSFCGGQRQKKEQ